MMSIRWLVLLVVLVGSAFLFVSDREDATVPEVAQPGGAVLVAVEPSAELGELPVEAAPVDVREVVLGEPNERVEAQKGVLNFVVRLSDGHRYFRPVEVRVRERRGQALGEPVSFFFDYRGSAPVIEVSSGVDLLVDYLPLADASYREFKPIALEVAALAPGETRELELQLEETHPSWFVGRVVDRETGEPIGGARIGSARGSKHEQGFRGVETQVSADAQGLFTIALPPSSRARRHVALADDWSAVLFDVVAGHETEARAFDVTMIRSARLRLTFEGIGALEAPVVTVRTKSHFFRPEAPNVHASFRSGADHTWSLAVDGRGQVEVELPGQATFSLEFEAGGLVRKYPELVSLDAGETREIVWSIGTGARVHGRLTDRQGRPIPGADLWLVRSQSRADGGSYLSSLDESMAEARVQTDASGGFEFTHIDAGYVRIGPKGAANTNSELEDYCRVAFPVVIPEGAEDVEVDVVVQRGLKIKGRVIKPDGSPLFGCYVWVVPVGGSGRLRAETDGKGLFELEPLTDGPHLFTTYVGLGNFVDPAPQVIEAGAEDLEIQVIAGSTVSGSVFDAETGELVRAFIALADESWSSLRGTEFRKPGAFSWDRLGAGTYTLYATTRDGRVATPQVIDLGAGEDREGFELYLKAGVGLEVYYSGSTEFGTYSITVDALPVLRGRIEDGDEEVLLLPPGHIVIEWTAGSSKQAKQFDLVGGDRERVEFTSP